jgi:hypothetical protein
MLLLLLQWQDTPPLLLCRSQPISMCVRLPPLPPQAIKTTVKTWRHGMQTAAPR